MRKRIYSGFTLIEILIVIAIIGIMSTIMIVAVNPGRQLAKARDTQRQSDLTAIISIIYQYASEHSGDLPDTDGNPLTSNFPTTYTCIGTDLACFNLAGAGEAGDEIVPVYLLELPRDPKVTSTAQKGTNVNTGYEIMVDANGHIYALAPSAETETVEVKK